MIIIMGKYNYVKALLLLLFFSVQSIISEDQGQCRHIHSTATSEEINESGFLPQPTLMSSSCHSTLGNDVQFKPRSLKTGLEFLYPYLKTGFHEELTFGNIEFIRPDFQNDLNEKLNFGNGTSLQERGVLDVVRAFIRIMKRLPNTVSFGELVGFPNEDNKKPAWSYYPYQLRKLAKTEVTIYKVLKQFYDRSAQTLYMPVLESYLRDIEESSLRAISNSNSNVEESYAKIGQEDSDEDPYLYIGSHPLLIYRMIKRFAEDLQPILSKIDEIQEDIIMELYERANPDLLIFPTSEDLSDALDSIKRIQTGTNLKTEEFARGMLENVDTRIQLNAIQALEIGAYFHDQAVYDYSLQWIYLALEAISECPTLKNYPFIQQFFERTLQHAVETHNLNWQTVSQNRWNPDVFDKQVSVPFDSTSYRRMFDHYTEESAGLKNQHFWNWAITNNFVQVCSGVNLQSDEEKATLKCWFQWHHNPYWYINPLKMELLHANPPVYQIYDFIGPQLAATIKKATLHRLERSTVVDRNHPSKSVIDSTRTSAQVWVYDTKPDGSFMIKLTRQLEHMSQLTIEPSSSSDAFQVANYGPSHHYAAHIDSFEDPRRCIERGNRVTTIMGYLSDVKAGGRTGFPVLGIAAEPIKGSLVMWNSLMRNGEERDMRSWHGGCPVVLGLKWITNKWVYYKDNFKNFKCGLDPAH